MLTDMAELSDLRWYADTVERVTFSDGNVIDNPKFRLQQYKQIADISE